MFSDLDDSLLICTACGTQFDTAARTELTACRICDDPRQFVPPCGQTFTTLGDLKSSGIYGNKTARVPENNLVMSIWTEPKFAIGQRAFLIQTSGGNFLWDLVAYIDQATIDLIKVLGGLKAIVISHPHYYTTYVVWARIFNCPVYISSEDSSWVCRHDDAISLRKMESSEFDVINGMGMLYEAHFSDLTAIKVGGHFPGSRVLCCAARANNMLLISDSIVTVPSALYFVNRPPGTASYSFMWSIPNMIPLSPRKIIKIIRRLNDYDFQSTHGAFNGQDLRDGPSGCVQEMLKYSAQIAVGAMLEWNPEEYDAQWNALWERYDMDNEYCRIRV